VNIVSRLSRVASVLGAICLAAVLPAAGQDKAGEKSLKWTDTAELSLVTTSGNSESTTFGFKDTLHKSWERSSFELKAGGVRAQSTAITRIGVGPDPSNFSVHEDRTSTLSAESYFLNGRYDRTISRSFFWFVGAGWDRNRFAGVQNRYSGAGGIGNNWIDSDRVKFRTDYSATYTKEDDVFEAPGIKKDYAGARVTSKFVHKIGATSAFGNDVAIDENLSETKDLRVDMTNWVTASLTSRLALKVSLQWLYDNQPAVQVVSLDNPLGTPTGLTVPVSLDRLDSVVTASLVVNF
jgi:Protein of unknown function, DUF481